MYRKLLFIIIFSLFLGVSSISTYLSLFLIGVITLIIMFVNDKIPVYVFIITIPLFNVSKYYMDIFLSFNEYLLISVFLFLLVFRRNKGFGLEGIHAVNITYIIFLVCSFIIHSEVDRFIMLKEVTKFILYIFTFYIAYFSIKDYKTLNGTIVTILISAALVALNGVFQYAVGSSIISWQPWGPMFEFTTGKVRSYSTFDNPIYLGAYMALIIGIIVGLLNYIKSSSFRVILLIHLGVCLLAMFFSFSRGGWVGIGVSMILVVVFVLRKRGIALMAVMISFSVMAFYVLPSVFIERLLNIVDFTDSSIIQRLYAYESAINMIKDNVIWGIGPGRFKEVYPTYRLLTSSSDPTTFTAENTFLEYFVENGIVIIILYTLLWILFYKNTFYIYSNNNNPVVKGYALGTIIGMTALLIDSMFAQITNSAIVMLYWFIFGASFALRTITRKEIDNKELSREGGKSEWQQSILSS